MKAVKGVGGVHFYHKIDSYIDDDDVMNMYPKPIISGMINFKLSGMSAIDFINSGMLALNSKSKRRQCINKIDKKILNLIRIYNYDNSITLQDLNKYSRKQKLLLIGIIKNSSYYGIMFEGDDNI